MSKEKQKPRSATTGKSPLWNLLPRLSLPIKGKGLIIFFLVLMALIALGYGGFQLYTAQQTEEAGVILVDVAGAVQSPGVYELPEDSRVQDALDLAGGLTPDADESTINRAAVLEDGARVFIPTRPAVTTEDTNTPSDTPSVDSDTGMVNINTADVYVLQTLPGIGPVIAERIINYRAVHGPFTRIEDLQNVEGIGPGILEKIRSLIEL
ncbi:MAG: helix-hairpin-helix domain-containing protein [Coriobacteriales bacterium]|jgi:competence protein ComEA|nr:helix-hairpin-helix domain-containing protein [Coriobacteriales bacterium]